ncbi:MAG: hypothetical protein HWN79_08490 [Candidatus Lokiarchaeota archaeon]|nr:hypothetical protein [Candidatus Lokiarchaeota archaeon]
MSKNIRDYEFRSDPKEITYLDDEPLKLEKDFSFFHNKNKFRKELTRLQMLFKNYTGISLLASGIRDSYLKDELSNKFYIVAFTTNQVIKDTNKLIDPYKDANIKPGCFYLECRPNYMLLLAKDMEGLVAGVDALEDIITQTFKDYFEQKNREDYVKIKPFKLFSCGK